MRFLAAGPVLLAVVVPDPAIDEMIAPIYIVKVTVNDSSSDATSRDDALREIAGGIATLAARRRCAAARRVHHSGISLGHLQILWILQEHGPLPVSRLADWLGIGVPNATGLLDRMEQRGLVERVRDAEDRRVVLARMTDLGRDAVAEHDGWRADLVQELLAPLPTEQLLAVAARVRRALDLAPDGGVVPEREVAAR
jgi:DNA-binding MarR family transcriptional regulator